MLNIAFYCSDFKLPWSKEIKSFPYFTKTPSRTSSSRQPSPCTPADAPHHPPVTLTFSQAQNGEIHVKSNDEEQTVVQRASSREVDPITMIVDESENLVISDDPVKEEEKEEVIENQLLSDNHAHSPTPDELVDNKSLVEQEDEVNELPVDVDVGILTDDLQSSGDTSPVQLQRPSNIWSSISSINSFDGCLNKVSFLKKLSSSKKSPTIADSKSTNSPKIDSQPFAVTACRRNLWSDLSRRSTVNSDSLDSDLLAQQQNCSNDTDVEVDVESLTTDVTVEVGGVGDPCTNSESPSKMKDKFNQKMFLLDVCTAAKAESTASAGDTLPPQPLTRKLERLSRSKKPLLVCSPHSDSSPSPKQ